MCLYLFTLLGKQAALYELQVGMLFTRKGTLIKPLEKRWGHRQGLCGQLIVRKLDVS